MIFGGAVTEGGAFSAATTILESATVSFNASITSLGAVSIDASSSPSTLEIATSQSLSITSLAIYDGTLTGAADVNLNVTGPMTWVGGTIAGIGSLHAAGSLTLGDPNNTHAANPDIEDLVGVYLLNATTATWSGANDIYLYDARRSTTKLRRLSTRSAAMAGSIRSSPGTVPTSPSIIPGH